jgi:phosphoribosylformimino-5-aminoimidazole carboxamide ribotide isomerase
MKTGIIRLAINSMAVENKIEFLKVFEKYGPSKIVISLDILGEQLMVNGRRKKTEINFRVFAKEWAEAGVNRFIVCDISRNGTLFGPNIQLSKEIAESTNAKVTHAGGIRNKDELMDIQSLIQSGVDSVIVGRALYENRFPCQKLWRVAESGLFN